MIMLYFALFYYCLIRGSLFAPFRNILRVSLTHRAAAYKLITYGEMSPSCPILTELARGTLHASV